MTSSNLILFDDVHRDRLLPLVFTRPVCDLRLGILTIREKWEKVIGGNSSTITQPYLTGKYPTHEADDNLVINGAVCPNEDLVAAVGGLAPGQWIGSSDTLIAGRLDRKSLQTFIRDRKSQTDSSYNKPANSITRMWDIFHLNDSELRKDFDLLTRGRQSSSINKTNTVLGDDIFLDDGAKVEASVLNSVEGPIYIGKDAEVMEGSLIRGPFALCEGSTLKMGSKIYGPTTIGPHCKVGGEVKNSVIMAYSNKAHDGFLGNSVIGEWCNIGADSNNSNLKNNYSNVKVWDYATQDYINSGTQFCGLFMGDHSKCGINTMFNTGTVVGVSANVFGAGFTSTHIPSFTWGGIDESKEYNVDVALKVARAVMARRDVELDEATEQILRHVFEITARDRKATVVG